MGDVPTGAARRRALGAYGEDLACAYLTEHGYRILARNWRCRNGELDIVALDGDCLVGCEVKTRSSQRFGAPEESVTPTKVARLRGLVAQWLAQCAPTRLPRRPRDTRLDVVAVELPPRGAAILRHLVGVG